MCRCCCHCYFCPGIANRALCALHVHAYKYVTKRLGNVGAFDSLCSPVRPCISGTLLVEQMVLQAQAKAARAGENFSMLSPEHRLWLVQAEYPSAVVQLLQHLYEFLQYDSSSASRYAHDDCQSNGLGTALCKLAMDRRKVQHPASFFSRTSQPSPDPASNPLPHIPNSAITTVANPASSVEGSGQSWMHQRSINTSSAPRAVQPPTPPAPLAPRAPVAPPAPARVAAPASAPVATPAPAPAKPRSWPTSAPSDPQRIKPVVSRRFAMLLSKTKEPWVKAVYQQIVQRRSKLTKQASLTEIWQANNGSLSALLSCLKKRDLEDLHMELFGTRNSYKSSDSSTKQSMQERIYDWFSRSC